MDEVNKNKKISQQHSAKMAGQDYFATLANRANTSTEYAESVLAAAGWDNDKNRVKSINQLNIKNPLILLLIIEQHIEEVNLNSNAANMLSRMACKWILELGPKTAFKDMSKILMKSRSSRELIKRLTTHNARCQAGRPRVDIGDFIPLDSICWNHAIFANCKKCNKSHNCFICGADDHSLVYCDKIDHKIRKRMDLQNQRWRNKSNFRNKSRNNNKLNRYNNNNNNNNNSNSGNNNNGNQ